MYFWRSSLDSADDISLRRTDDGAAKCALRALRRDEDTSAAQAVSIAESYGGGGAARTSVVLHGGCLEGGSAAPEPLIFVEMEGAGTGRIKVHGLRIGGKPEHSSALNNLSLSITISGRSLALVSFVYFAGLDHFSVRERRHPCCILEPIVPASP